MESGLGATVTTVRAVISSASSTGRTAAMLGGGAPVLVGRQGVYRADLTVDGYELLFRSRAGTDPGAPDLTDNQMTADVLMSALDIGLDHLVGDRRVYVKVSPDLLRLPWDAWLPNARTVIEIQLDRPAGPELVADCRDLIDRGFTIALHDFQWFDGAETILGLASMVQLDLMSIPESELAAVAARCNEYDVTLLAEKVEDLSQIATLRELGFELFQGHVLEVPQVVASRTVEMTSLARLQDAARMLNETIDIAELERLIRSDPGMVYQLIRLASVGRPGEMRREVASLRDALVVLGTRRVQQFIAIFLARPSGVEWSPSFVGVLARARACEALTAQLYPAMSSLGFAAGLISALDGVLGIPVWQLVSSMSLSGPLAIALLDPESQVGAILSDLIAYQFNDLRHARASAATMVDLDVAFGHGFAWATRTMAAVAPVAA